MKLKIKKVGIEKTSREPPDIDSDFFDREAIINYLIKKYGQNHVAMVGTVTTYSPKNAIQDIGTVFEIPSSETTAITKIYNSELSIEENIQNVHSIKVFFQKYPQIKELIPKFVNTIRSFGIHAGGVILTDKKYPINKYFALQRTQEDSKIATFWTKEEVEKMGGIKMDILGLNCCGQIHKVKEMVGLDPYKLHPQEEIVYKEIVTKNKHKNIFQFDSNIGAMAFSQIVPMNIHDLSAASGIIRITGTEEGRKAYNSFRENIHAFQSGDTNIVKKKIYNEVVEPYNRQVCIKILSETYGVLIYQEQLIKLVQFLSKGRKTFQDGNRLRKALDKKIFGKYGTVDKLQGNKDILKKWHTDIMALFEEYLLPYIGKDGWESNDPIIQDFLNFRLDENNRLPIPEKGILNWFIVSSAYLFSVIHAKAYSLMGYEQMYQKYYYPKEFWLCALNLGKKEQVNEYILAARSESNIKFLPPNYKNSESLFSFEGANKDIRYGLSFIKGCDKAVDDIILERKNKPFENLKDFCSRMYYYSSMKKNVWENLFFAGVFFEESIHDDEVFRADYVENIIHTLKQEAWVDLTEYIEKTEDFFAKKEFEMLNTNITFIHPMLQDAHLYNRLDSIVENTSGTCMLKIESVKEKKSKNGNVYKHLKVTCMNSFITDYLFCFDLTVNFKKGEIYILPIVNNNGFISIDINKNNNKWKR